MLIWFIEPFKLRLIYDLIVTRYLARVRIAMCDTDILRHFFALLQVHRG